MDREVREILCSSCSHRNVCAYKDDYLNMLKSLQEMFYKISENEREFMYLRDPDCKYHSKGLSTPRTVISENANAKKCANMIAEEARNAMEKQAHNLY